MRFGGGSLSRVARSVVNHVIIIFIGIYRPTSLKGVYLFINYKGAINFLCLYLDNAIIYRNKDC